MSGRQTIDYDPVEALLDQGRRDLATGDREKARWCFEEVLRRRPDDARALLGMSYVERKSERPAADGASILAADLQVVQLVREKRYEEALDILRREQLSRPDDEAIARSIRHLMTHIERRSAPPAAPPADDVAAVEEDGTVKRSGERLVADGETDSSASTMEAETEDGSVGTSTAEAAIAEVATAEAATAEAFTADVAEGNDDQAASPESGEGAPRVSGEHRVAEASPETASEVMRTAKNAEALDAAPEEPALAKTLAASEAGAGTLTAEADGDSRAARARRFRERAPTVPMPVAQPSPKADELQEAQASSAESGAPALSEGPKAESLRLADDEPSGAALGSLPSVAPAPDESETGRGGMMMVLLLVVAALAGAAFWMSTQ